MKPACFVHMTDKYIFVWTVSRTKAGFGEKSNPFIRLDSDAPDRLIGAAALLAMAGSRDGVPGPSDDWKDKQKDYLRMQGFTSMNAFISSARFSAVWLAEEGARVELKARGEGDAIVPRGLPDLQVPAEDEPLGHAIRQALESFAPVA